MTAPKITGGTITGSTINNSAIGGTTAAAGAFTTLSATGVTTVQAGTVSLPAITTTGDTNTGIFFPAADTIAFTEGGVESMRIDSSGNVGIGTATTNNSKFTVAASTSGTGGIRIESQFGSSYFGNYNNYPAMMYDGASLKPVIVYDTNNNANILYTNNTEKMRIDSSGNVGIGTSSPATQLQMNSGASTYSDQLRIRNTNFGNADIGVGSGIMAIATDMSNITFYTSSSLGTTGSALPTNERMRIDSSGNVLIGTTTAGLKLTVQAGVTIVSGDQSTCRLVLQNTTSPGRTFSLVAGTVGVGNDDFTIYDNTASATRVTLKANGEFIIGTADNGDYNLQCNGTGVWGAGAYVNGSDARIKEDIAPIESGLDVVKKLNPVTYRYKEEWSKDQSTQTGFIAQELLTALSGQVYVDGVVQQGGEYMSVAYQNIIPILTKAIQELNAKVEAQAVRIAELESK
jgi:hypothetical protein